MYPAPRPFGSPPNYTIRRLIALTVVVLVGLVIYRAVQALGTDDGASTVAAGPESSSPTTMPMERPPTCGIDERTTAYAQPEDWARTIVDGLYGLPDGYEPPDLVPASKANYASQFQIRSIIADDLNGIRNAILAAGLPEVALFAAYRSAEDQSAPTEDSITPDRDQPGPEGRTAASPDVAAGTSDTARPGHSEHDLGTAIDFRLVGETDVDQSFGDTPTGEWLESNSWRHGFVLSYPEGAEDITCNTYEPWHFRYVGTDLAAKVERSGLTLREYLWHWEVTGSEPAAVPTTSTSSTTVPSEPAGG